MCRLSVGRPPSLLVDSPPNVAISGLVTVLVTIRSILIVHAYSTVDIFQDYRWMLDLPLCAIVSLSQSVCRFIGAMVPLMRANKCYAAKDLDVRRIGAYMERNVGFEI